MEGSHPKRDTVIYSRLSTCQLHCTMCANVRPCPVALASREILINYASVFLPTEKSVRKPFIITQRSNFAAGGAVWRRSRFQFEFGTQARMHDGWAICDGKMQMPNGWKLGLGNLRVA